MKTERNRFDQNRLKENPEIAPYFDDIPAETAARAYNGTSQFPERAGSLDRSSYALSLIEDRKKVQNEMGRALKQGADKPEDSDKMIERWFISHRQGLKGAWLAYFASHSNCISSFITGPSNFPVARAQKLNRYASNKMEAITEFRRKSRKRIMRQLLPLGDGSAIKTEDPNAPEKIEAKVKALEAQRDNMKRANKAYTLGLKMGVNGLSMKDIPEEKIQKIQEKSGVEDRGMLLAAITFQPPYDYIKRPYTWEMSNLNANIRRLKKRKSEVSETKSLEINDTFPGGETATISDDGKIVIEFGYKPGEDLRAELKRHAFKWSRFRGAWVRKLTINAAYSYGRFVKPLLLDTERGGTV